MVRDPDSKPVRIPAELTPEQMRSGIDRIKRRIADLHEFPVSSIAHSSDPRITALEKSIEETLQRVFGAGTIEVVRYRDAARLRRAIGAAALAGASRREPLASDMQREFSDRKANSLALLGQAVKGLEEEIAESERTRALGVSANPPSPAARPKPSRKVFVVHGRDDAPKNEVALFLSSIGLNRSFCTRVLMEAATYSRNFKKNRRALASL